MRDDDADPGVVDRVGRDEREQRPDVRVRLAADVLARPGPQRAAERRLVAVDEEVDRLGLGDAEQGRGVADRLARRSSSALRANASLPSYQWIVTRSPLSVRQSCVVSLYRM